MVFDKLVRLDGFQLEINKRAVYSMLGYRRGRTAVTRKLTDLVETVVKEAMNLVDTKGVYIIRRIRDRADGITLLGSDVVLRGSSMEKLLADSFAVALMAVTIGPELERRVSEESEAGNMERSLVFDVVGSEAVEAAANSLNSHIVVQARQAKAALTRRFSPGYGDLPVDFQRDIYLELSLGELGIEINEKNILFPQKTITAVIGVEK